MRDEFKLELKRSTEFKFELDDERGYARVMTQALSPAEIAAVRAYLQSGALLRKAAGAVLAENSELSGLQYEIIRHTGASPEGVRMFALAEQCVHSRSGITYQVGRLEELGIVERYTRDENERAVWVKLTPAGEALHARLREIHSAMLRASFLDLVTADELATITAVGERIIDRFRAAE